MSNTPEEKLRAAIEELKSLLKADEEEFLNIGDVKEVISVKNLNLKEQDGKVSTLVTLAMKRKREEDYHPNEAQLEKINEFSKRTLKREDVYVFELQSADTNIDRAYEQFSSKAITRMAELSINKPVLMDHSWEVGATVGKIFDAKNQSGKLVQMAYFPTKSPIVENIMNGLIDKLSVGFALEPENFVCSACSKSMFSMDCPHSPGEKTKGGDLITATIKDVSDYFEVSLVAVPCQQDAHIRQGKELVTTKSLTIKETVIDLPIPQLTMPETPAVDTMDIGNNSDKELNLMSDSANVEAVVEEQVVAPEAVAEETVAEAEPEVEVKSVTELVNEAIAALPKPEVKEVDFSPITEKVASLEAKLEEVMIALKDANEKLEVIISQPTSALSKKMSSAEATEAEALRKKYWVMDKFELTGGQE